MGTKKARKKPNTWQDLNPGFEVLKAVICSFGATLQAVVFVLSATLNFLNDCRLHLEEFHLSAVNVNNFSLACVFLITFTNILIAGLDPAASIDSST